ncbi:MAG: TonB-dependent receptor [Longimicrobiales bacterium]
MRIRSAIVTLVFAALAWAAPLAAQQTILTGRISSESGEPVDAASVGIVGTPQATSVLSNGQGVYRVALPGGTYDIVVTRLGHAQRRIDNVNVPAGQTTTLDILLPTRAEEMDAIQVTVDRGDAARVSQAVQTVHVVNAIDIAERPAPSLSEHIRTAPGVDVISHGLQASNVVVRGFNNIFSGALHMLTDNRLAGVPSLRVNLMHFIPSNEDDVERMEVVLGPGSALYGPNTANGVVHILTKSPLNSQGTTVTLGAGEQGAFMGHFRSAWRPVENFGFKVSGQYLKGDEWFYVDPAEDSARVVAGTTSRRPACISDKVVRGLTTAQAGTVCDRVGIRDYDIERWSGEVRADWRFADDGTLVATYGRTDATGIELTGLGAGQAGNWIYEFYQARMNLGRLFAQGYFNTTDAGDTYLLRDGMALTDQSGLWVGQIQHGFGLAEGRQDFTYGFDYFGTRPDTKGTINGTYESDDEIDEWGVYLQSKTLLTDQLDLILAGRLDDHSLVADKVFSPRAGLVYRPIVGHSVRLSYNRAFSTPSSLNSFLDISGGAAPQIGPLGYGVRAYGTGKDGWSLQPGGQTQFRSPFITSSGAYPIVPAPSPGALWPAAVGVLQAQGAINSQTATLLGSLTPTSTDIDWMLTDPTTRAQQALVGAVLDEVPAIEESYTESIELGWTGLFANRFQITADAYWMKKNNFVSPLVVQTPLLTMNGPDVGAFIATPYGTVRVPQLMGQGLTLAQAQAQVAAEVTALATGLATVPLGVVASSEIQGSSRPEIIVTYRNISGDIELWGADLAFEYFLNDAWTMTGSVSAVSDDYFRPENQAPIALNAPEFKGSLGVGYRNVSTGLTGGARWRFTSEFPAESAGYVGTRCIPDQPVGIFTEDCVEARGFWGWGTGRPIMDMNVAYKVPTTDATMQLVVNNIFDAGHRSFVGVPRIGRFAMLSVRYDLF